MWIPVPSQFPLAWHSSETKVVGSRCRSQITLFPVPLDRGFVPLRMCFHSPITEDELSESHLSWDVLVSVQVDGWGVKSHLFIWHFKVVLTRRCLLSTIGWITLLQKPSLMQAQNKQNGFSPWIRDLGIEWRKNRGLKISCNCPFQMTPKCMIECGWIFGMSFNTGFFGIKIRPQSK
jgi:hypothetical protein